jgi:hypothetical protein
MLIGFFKHNRAVSIVVLPITLILFWLYGFINPVAPVTEHSSTLYNLLIAGIKNPTLITFISFILIFSEALLVNYIVEKNEIINTNTYLPALVYITIMSLQPTMLTLSPIIISNLFMLLALHKLMHTYRKETAYSETFDTGLFISIGCLFYTPSIIFILLIWIGLVIIRPFVWREWVLSLIGLSLPWIYMTFAYFWINKLDMLTYDVFYQTIATTSKSISTIALSSSNIFQILILLLAIFFSINKFNIDFKKGTVRSRNNLLLLLYFLFLSVASIFMAPQYSICYLSFLAIPFSIFFSSYFLFARKAWLAEVLFLVLIISVFINQFIK